jgi:ABC-type uncharacterized transport system ATPase subunit
VRKGKPDPEARALSGGNLQKFVVGRELDRKPGCWSSTSRPGASMPVPPPPSARRSSTWRAAGSAVLVISQDLDEIFEVADRIAVISRGQLSEAYPAAGHEPPKRSACSWLAHMKTGRDRPMRHAA